MASQDRLSSLDNIFGSRGGGQPDPSPQPSGRRVDMLDDIFAGKRSAKPAPVATVAPARRQTAVQRFTAAASKPGVLASVAYVPQATQQVFSKIVSTVGKLAGRAAGETFGSALQAGVEVFNRAAGRGTPGALGRIQRAGRTIGAAEGAGMEQSGRAAAETFPLVATGSLVGGAGAVGAARGAAGKVARTAFVGLMGAQVSDSLWTAAKAASVSGGSTAEQADAALEAMAARTFEQFGQSGDRARQLAATPLGKGTGLALNLFLGVTGIFGPKAIERMGSAPSRVRQGVQLAGLEPVATLETSVSGRNVRAGGRIVDRAGMFPWLGRRARLVAEKQPGSPNLKISLYAPKGTVAEPVAAEALRIGTGGSQVPGTELTNRQRIPSGPSGAPEAVVGPVGEPLPVSADYRAAADVTAAEVRSLVGSSAELKQPPEAAAMTVGEVGARYDSAVRAIDDMAAAGRQGEAARLSEIVDDEFEDWTLQVADLAIKRAQRDGLDLGAYENPYDGLSEGWARFRDDIIAEVTDGADRNWGRTVAEVEADIVERYRLEQPAEMPSAFAAGPLKVESRKAEVFHGYRSGGKPIVDQSSKDWGRVRVIETYQEELINELAERGDGEARAILADRRDFYVRADRLIRDRYAGDYDAIEYRNSHRPQVGTEYHDLSDGKFYAESYDTAKAYAIQNRAAKYELSASEPRPETVRRKIELTAKPGTEAERAAAEAESAILQELQSAEAGERIQTKDEEGYPTGFVGVSSSFPEWIPQSLRRKELTDAVYRHVVDGTVPTRKLEVELYNFLADEIAAVAPARELVAGAAGADPSIAELSDLFELTSETYGKEGGGEAAAGGEQAGAAERDAAAASRGEAPGEGGGYETGKPAELRGYTAILKGKPDSGFRSFDRETAVSYGLDRGMKAEEVTEKSETLGNPFVATDQIDVLNGHIKEKYPAVVDQLLERYAAAVRDGRGTTNKDDVVIDMDRTIKDTLKGEGYDGVIYTKTKEYAVFDPSAVTPEVAQPRSGSVGASSGVFAEGEEVKLGGIDALRPVEFPELVQLARSLMGEVPGLRKFKTTYGKFYGTGRGAIKLKQSLFERGSEEQLAKTLAHEIGHLVDYLPEQTLRRGNLLGRLQSLRKFLSNTFGGTDAAKAKALRLRARKEVLAERGVSSKAYAADVELRASLRPEIKQRHESLLREADIVTNAEVRRELWEHSKRWRPLDEASAAGGYLAYRKSSAELYADALSALLVNPGALEAAAPTFYRQLFERMDAKPEVRDAYFGLQTLLRRGPEAVIAERRAGVREMFSKADYRALDLERVEREKREARSSKLWERFKFDVLEQAYPLIDRVNAIEKAGGHVNPDENPVYYLRESNYIGGKIKAILEASVQPIYRRLGEAGITWEDFGEALMYDRIVAGDRSDVANPRGLQPREAEELAKSMRADLGAERTAVLDASIAEFRTGLIRAAAEEAYREGLFEPEMYKRMSENEAYVPFQVVDYLESGTTWKVKGQVGTLKDIANPANSAILKVVSTYRAIERNKVSRSIAEFLKSKLPGEVSPAKTVFTGKGKVPVDPQDRDQGLLRVYEAGKLTGYYVDAYIVKSMERNTVAANNAIVASLRWMNSRGPRPLFITFNLGFQAFNLLRDFQRYYKNVPGATLLSSARRYLDPKVYRAARVRAFGLPDDPTAAQREAADLVRQLEREQVLSVTYNDVARGAELEDTQIEQIMRDLNVMEPTEGKVRSAAAMKPILAVLDFVQRLGNAIETLPKVGAYLELTRRGTMEPREMRDFIRRNVGSPDFLSGGYWKPATNEIFLFSNAIIQGIRSDLEIATGPKTRGGYWWKTAKVNVLPKLLMFLASIGAFGAAVKAMFDKVSEFDKANYTVIPLGEDHETGKAIYLRIPADETGRLISAIMWKALRAASGDRTVYSSLSDIVAYTGGQIPSVTPIIDSLRAAGQFVSGRNPYDWFRGRTVLTDDEWRAGGWVATKKYLQWQFEQFGGGIFYRFSTAGARPDKQAAAERVFSLPVVGNVIQRFLRVSDYGEIEKYREAVNRVSRGEARQRIAENEAVSDAVQSFLEDGGGSVSLMRRLAAERELIEQVIGHRPKTNEEAARAKRIQQKFRLLVKRGGSDARITALVDADTTKQRVELLRVYAEAVDKPTFQAFVRDLVSTGTVSEEVIEAYRRATR